jgi:hypothetical protein
MVHHQGPAAFHA